MSDGCLFDMPFTPTSQVPPNQLSLPMLKSWLSSYSYPSTTAGPLVATTITIEAIQDLLHANGYPIEAPCNVDMFSGPFDDTQFDAVVDVETCDDGIDADLKFTDLDACSEYGYCGSDFSEDDLSLLQDLPLSPDSPLLSDSADIDFGCDSGIEAEMDEPHDGADNEKEKKEKNKATDDDKKSSEKSTKEGTTNSQQQNGSKPQTENKEPHAKTRRTKEDDDEVDDDVDDDGEDDKDDEDNDNDLPPVKCQYLWEFLHHILLQKQNKYLVWKNQAKGVFRLIDHNGLARLWGKQKNRKNMTYEKLSRALRYYYSKNILRKVPGQRLTYKFVHNLNGKKYPL